MFSKMSKVTRVIIFFFNDTATTEIYTLSLHDALPISRSIPPPQCPERRASAMQWRRVLMGGGAALGAAAAYNAMACHDVPPLANPVGGREGYFDWRGSRIAYTDRKSTRLNSSHANISYA